MVVLWVILGLVALGFVGERIEHRRFCREQLPPKIAWVEKSLQDSDISPDRRSELEMWLWQLQGAKEGCEK